MSGDIGNKPAHLIYVVGIDKSRDAWLGHAVRGVRALWDTVEPDNPYTYRQARREVQRFVDNPSEAMPIGQHTNESILSDAVGIGLERSEGVLTFAVDLEDTTLVVPEPSEGPVDGTDAEDEDLLSDVYSPAAYKTAVAFMALADGNPTAAYNRTYLMQRATDDETLWEEVRAVYESVFLHDDGPNVTVVGG